MKILQATTARGWSGGTEQCLLLAKYMNKLGYETHILTFKNCELDKRAENLGIKRVHFPNTKKFSLKEARKLSQIIQNYDIVNTHISKAHWFIWLASLFTRKRPKLIYTRRVFFDISMISAITKYNINVDAIIGISHEIYEKLRNYPLIKKKIHYIPSGIELDRFNPYIKTKISIKEDLNIPSNAIVITHIANFSEVKGQHILLKAFQKFTTMHPDRNLVLLLAGRDTQSEKAYQLIKKLNLTKKVIPLGFRRDVPQILKDTDIFVFPSLSEGLGSSLLQAMAMKKIVVASYVGGIKTYLKHMENGIAVEPGSIESLYKGLLTAIENINNEKLKENARKTALDFDIEKVVDRTLKVYREVLNGVS
ncbi:Glycosyltransferase involved in cell wall bisynthesis [Desulfurobacterium pacificum]|uniref:Glycosyltransferase involved in cell wall bisynthesis n=1 Tax=Desulfurobacterium pacificum TaxID=240166 RepID=A0ABY1NY64_9BACT|nr:glycosyltransferase family 4 protein [Desulfurobacterium pacificum]SMP18991.1 Glycosyltransferase involved in cell wall bisynthesis [Desulfurobacterium pacificum]